MLKGCVFGCVKPFYSSPIESDNRLRSAELARLQKAPAFAAVPVREFLPRSSDKITVVVTGQDLMDYLTDPKSLRARVVAAVRALKAKKLEANSSESL